MWGGQGGRGGGHGDMENGGEAVEARAASRKNDGGVGGSGGKAIEGGGDDGSHNLAIIYGSVHMLEMFPGQSHLDFFPGINTANEKQKGPNKDKKSKFSVMYFYECIILRKWV